MSRYAALVLTFLAVAGSAGAAGNGDHWIGTWAAAAQPAREADAQVFMNQTIRLIVHVTAGGSAVRIRLSNTFGDGPLVIGAAHVATRTSAAAIDPATDRAVHFHGKASATINAGSTVVSDTVALDVAPLTDLAISLYLPQKAVATTSHSLALQTNYVAAGAGDQSAQATLLVDRTITQWPFLTGIDVASTAQSATIVAFGSSTTDGDGSTRDANRRWPDILAERLHADPAIAAGRGVLNEGIIGNRLLHDSPRQPGNPFGPVLGESGLQRFGRDVLIQPAVKYVFIALGVNDILFPAFPFTPAGEAVMPADIISGYRQLIARARRQRVRVIGTTIPPFEGATFSASGVNVTFYTDDRERARQAVNDWIRGSGEFDAVVDFDAVVRDPSHPARLLPAYAAADHLHVNDAGNLAQANAIPLTLFERS